MKCIVCGKEFTPKVCTQKSCSPECSHEHRRELYRMHYKNPGVALTEQRRTCAVCGKEFTPKTDNQLVCSPACSAERMRENARVRQRAARQRAASNQVPTQPRTCVICGKQFVPKVPKQKTCSSLCAKELNVRETRRRLGYEAPAHAPRKCVICGKEFTPKASTHKYCSALCRENSCGRLHARHARIDKPKAAPTSLDEWIRKAQECNLDYGTYRALIAQGKTHEQLLADADKRSMPTHAHNHKWL